MHLVCLVLSNTDVARVEAMLNIRLGHSVRPQPYKKINNTCASSTTLSTSFNEPLQWFTSKSMMLGCPSKAALKTCQAPLQETQHTDNNKGKSGRECTENTSPQIISTNMAAVVQGKVKNYSASTPTLPTGCFHSMNPTHFNLVHLYYLSHACTLVTQLTTDNVPHRTPEGTPIGLVRTSSLRHEQWNPACTCRCHAISHQHVLLELHGAPCWIHSCQFCGAMTPSLVPDNITLATICSIVQSIPPML